MSIFRCREMNYTERCENKMPYLNHHIIFWYLPHMRAEKALASPAQMCVVLLRLHFSFLHSRKVNDC